MIIFTHADADFISSLSFVFTVDGRELGRFPAAYLEEKYGFSPDSIGGSFGLI